MCANGKQADPNRENLFFLSETHSFTFCRNQLCVRKAVGFFLSHGARDGGGRRPSPQHRSGDRTGLHTVGRRLVWSNPSAATTSVRPLAVVVAVVIGAFLLHARCLSLCNFFCFFCRSRFSNAAVAIENRNWRRLSGPLLITTTLTAAAGHMGRLRQSVRCNFVNVSETGFPALEAVRMSCLMNEYLYLGVGYGHFPARTYSALANRCHYSDQF